MRKRLIIWMLLVGTMSLTLFVFSIWQHFLVSRGETYFLSKPESIFLLLCSIGLIILTYVGFTSGLKEIEKRNKEE